MLKLCTWLYLYLNPSAVQDEVEVGIESLLRAREQDPYLDPPTRLFYERVRGEPAPTFPAPVLDAAILRTRLAKEGKRRRDRTRGGTGAGAGVGVGAGDGKATESPVEADELRREAVKSTTSAAVGAGAK